MDGLNYRGKFRYPPEIDPENEIDRKWLAMNGIEEVHHEEYYRPKSVLVSEFLIYKTSFSCWTKNLFAFKIIYKAIEKIEMTAERMSKALFNPNQINELIELIKVEANPTNIVKRPKSSHVNYYFLLKFLFI